MLSQLISFEFSYQRKQYFFFIGAFLFLFFGLILVKQTYDINYNSSYKIAYQTSLVSLGSVFMIMFFVISGVLRERNHQMESLIFSTKLSKFHFFVSRFLGVFVFSLLAFSFLFLGLIIGLFVHNLDSTRIAEFNFLHYLWSWIIFALPNVFICSSLIFSVALLSKNSLAVYSSAVFIYMFYFLCSMFFDSPLMAASTSTSAENLQLAAIFDPFGISAFFEQTTYWTNQEKNNSVISLLGNLLINRLLWIVIGFVTLGFAYKLFSFRTSNTSIKKQKIITEKENAHFIFKAITPNYTSFKTHWNSYLIQTKINLELIFKSLPFLAVLFVFMVIFLIESYTRTTNGGAYNESLLPVTFILISFFKDVLKPLALFLIVFYSGELVWKERELKFNGILEALPVKNTTLFFSKLTVLLALPFILIVVGILLSIALQVSKGYFNFELDLYLSVFYYQGATMIFYSILALFIQNLVKNKYLGILLFGCFVLIFGTSLSFGIGIEHPLLRFGSLPNVSYSDINGYNVGGFHYLALHWTFIGLFLAILTFRIWKRGEKTISFRDLFSNLVSPKKSNLVLVVAFIFPLFSTAFIFYKTNIETEYLTQNEQLDRQENYERNYKGYENLEKLVPVSIFVEMDIFPNEKRYITKVKCILKNKSDSIITKLFITEKEKLSNLILQDAKLIKRDSILEIFIYEFENPILPNQEITFSYQIDKEVKAFETSKSILKNGSYITLREFFPILSYAKSREIKDSHERELRNLPKRIEEKINEDDLANEENDNKKGIGKIKFEAIISTSSDQIAITSGDLIKKWTQNKRNYYHYKTPILISPTVAFFSANYELKKENYKGISIEQYYHSSHNYNNQKIRESIKSTLDYCNQNYGKYPFKELRIAEIPSYWNFGGFAHAGTISMVEHRLYLIDTRNENDFELVIKRTIHEIAHQWWGHTLSPKNVEGASLLIEGLAKYNEAVIMEKMSGKKALFQLGKTANKQYFKGKTYTNETEPALYLALGESYLSYGKSYSAMLSLKELIGETKVNQVLKNLVEKHKNETEFGGTSLDFLKEVYQVTPQNYHSLIDDWFKRRIIYDLKIENVTSKKLNNDARGKYEITIQLKAKRFETLKSKNNATEKTVSISINESISIGLFSNYPTEISKENEHKEIIYLDSKIINKELNTFTFYVNELPVFVAIDPFFTRLDKNLDDNFMKIGE